jgi:two-component system, chemotaxis family, sensor kinase CheA
VWSGAVNEFLEAFLVEARDLVDQATRDLLVLEQAPRDRSGIDSVFRAFHTLKGAAGIVEFPAMAAVMHAAEDSLAAVRSGDAAITADRVGDYLSCLDQVLDWLAAIEADGALPEVPETTPAALVARFAKPQPAPAVEIAVGRPGWAEALLRAAGERPVRTAFRYAPALGARSVRLQSDRDGVVGRRARGDRRGDARSLG